MFQDNFIHSAADHYREVSEQLERLARALGLEAGWTNEEIDAAIIPILKSGGWCPDLQDPNQKVVK